MPITPCPMLPSCSPKRLHASTRQKVRCFHSLVQKRSANSGFSLLASRYALNKWAEQSRCNDSWYASSSIVVAETVDDGTVEPAADVYETGATYGDVYEIGATSIDNFDQEATYVG